MTNEELKEIEARAEKATPGPWENGKLNQGPIAGGIPITTPGYHDAFRNGVLVTTVYGTAARSEANAALIASARTDIPALVAEVRRLRSIVNEVVNILYDAPEFNTTDSRVEDLLLAIREAYFILTSQGDRA